MRIVAVVEHEGGQWMRCRAHRMPSLSNVHAIMFSDGSIWDVINGMRRRYKYQRTIRRALRWYWNTKTYTPTYINREW